MKPKHKNGRGVEEYYCFHTSIIIASLLCGTMYSVYHWNVTDAKIAKTKTDILENGELDFSFR